MIGQVRCKSCGVLVSADSKVCIGCGAQPRRKGRNYAVAFLFAVEIAVVIGLGYGAYRIFTRPPTTEEVAAQLASDRSFAARTHARSLLDELLAAPSTADFGDTESARLSGTEDRWLVRGNVDSQNGFGAMIRTRYELIVEFEPGTDRIVEVIAFNHR